MTTTGLTPRRGQDGGSSGSGRPGHSEEPRRAGPAGSSRGASTGGLAGNPATVAYVLVSAVLRGVAAALAGLVLLGGLALLVWAITPTTGSNAGGLLRSSTVVFAAGHFLPVTVAGTALTIRPLAVTLIAVLVVASAASRGKSVHGRTVEAVHGLVLAVAYAATVDLIARYLVPSQDVRLTAAPLLVAGLGVVLGLATHRTAWNRWWRRSAPRFLRAGLRAGAAAVCLLLAAAAVAVVVGLAASFRDAVQVAGLVAPGPGDGFALTLLSLAFLPNAVVAGLGYLSGAGFVIGAGSYSPFGSAPVELPAIPLLTAAPDGHASSRLGLAVLLIPAVAGVVVAVWIDRRLGLRWKRMAAAAVASAFAVLVVAGLAAAAGGGVAGGSWATTGVPPLLAAGATAGVLALVSLAWTGVAGLRGVPWRAAPELRRTRRVAAEAGAGVAAGGSDGPEDGSRHPASETKASAVDTAGNEAADGAESAGAAESADGADGAAGAAGAADAPDAAGLPEAYEITAIGALAPDADGMPDDEAAPPDATEPGPDGAESGTGGGESGTDVAESGTDVAESGTGGGESGTDVAESGTDVAESGTGGGESASEAVAVEEPAIDADDPLSPTTASPGDPGPDADHEFPASPDDPGGTAVSSPSATSAAADDVRAG